MLHLPPTKRPLHPNTNKPSQTNPRGIAHSRRPQTELAVLFGHFLADSGERADVHQAAQQTFPEDYGEDEPDARDERVHCVGREGDEVEDLQDRGRVERSHADEGEGGARDEDAELIDCTVGWVEGAKVLEGGGIEGEEESWGYALVDGVFGHVDEEEREHVWYDEGAGAVEFGREGMCYDLEARAVVVGW